MMIPVCSPPSVLWIIIPPLHTKRALAEQELLIPNIVMIMICVHVIAISPIFFYIPAF